MKTGQFSNADAEEYLVQTLIARRDKIGRHWLNRLSSFDDFFICDEELRFDHLASQYHFAVRPEYRVAWFAFDQVSGARHAIAQAAGLTTAGITVAEITSTEGKVDVYFRNQAGFAEIVGVER